MEILKGTGNFLYNTDEKTETKNEVGSSQGCQARFGPQLPGGLWETWQKCQQHYSGIQGVSSLPEEQEGRESFCLLFFSKLLHFVYSFASEQDYACFM